MIVAAIKSIPIRIHSFMKRKCKAVIYLEMLWSNSTKNKFQLPMQLLKLKDEPFFLTPLQLVYLNYNPKEEKLK